MLMQKNEIDSLEVNLQLFLLLIKVELQLVAVAYELWLYPTPNIKYML